jgi:hypothetical protein
MPRKRCGPTPLQKLGRRLRISAGLEPPIKRRKRRPKEGNVDGITGRLPSIFDELKTDKKRKKEKRKNASS